MSFAVHIMKTSDPINKVSKTTQTLATVQCDAKGPVSLLSPTLLLAITDDIAVPSNYLYIPNFGRYYYTKSTVYHTGLVTVAAQVDPLMSWAAQIRASRGMLARSETGNNLITDAQHLTQANRDICLKKFPKGFGSQCFVLTLAGPPHVA